MRNSDGEPYSIPDQHVSEALNSGFQLETPTQAATREYVDENKGLKGAVKTGLVQALDELAIGLPEMIYDQTEDPLEVAKKEALKKEHMASNAIGGTAGFLGSLAYGGPIFKAIGKGGQVATKGVQKLFTAKLAEQGLKQTGKMAAAKSIAAKTIDKTAQLATEGVLLSSPYAITEAALADNADPMERFGIAAESLAAGGLLSATFGLGSRASKGALDFMAKPVKGLSKAVVNPIKKQFNPRDVVVNVFDPTPTELRKFTKRHGDDFQDDLLDITKKIGMDLETVDPEDFLPRVQSYLDDRVAALDDLAVNAKGTTDSAEVGRKVIQELSAMKAGATKAVGGTNSVNTLNKLIDEVDDRFVQNARQVNASELLELKRATSAEINFNKEIGKRTTQDAGQSKAVREFDKAIEEIVDKNNPDIANAWRGANREVSILLDVMEPLRRKAGRDIKRPFASVGSAASLGTGALVGGAVGDLVGDETAMGLGVAGGIALSPIFRNYRNFGILYSENAMKRVSDKLETIPSVITNMVKRPKMTVDEIRQKATLTGVRLGQTKEEKVENFERIRDRVLQFTENPDFAAKEISDITGVLASTGAPQISEAYARKNALMSKYFGDMIPKKSRPSTAYYKADYPPNDAELANFEQRLRVIENPFSVLDDMEEGSLTPESVEALKAIYPAIFKRIQGKFIESLQDTDEELPYTFRLQLALLLEEPTDPSLEMINFFQQTYADEEEQQAQNAAKPVKVQDMQTDVTRISNK